jgi:cytochrome c peroxidase
MRNSMIKTIRFAVAALAATAAAQALAGGPADRAAAFRDTWTAADINVLSTLRLSQLPATPQDPSNAVEGSRAAIDLGKRLFNDVRFSANQAVSCATCHDPNKQFQDGLPLGRGVGTGARRAMPIVGSGHSPWLFWDGRKDSLWSQALGPLEDAVEHGGNRGRYAHLMQTHYRADYETIFSVMPDLHALPADASPLGTAAEKTAWSSMDGQAQDDINRVFANMGKAIAAYEKSLAHGASRFDRYVEGVVRRDPAAKQSMTPQEVNGLRIFIGSGQCVSCHNGPLFSDQQFHNTAVPPRNLASPDRGRAAATSKVQNDEFNCLGRFSDAKPAQCSELRFMVTSGRELEGAFKTPSLRDVALRAPYMHAGQMVSLEAVIAHYMQAPPAVVGHSELAHGEPGHSARAPIRLTESEVKDLVAFLGSVSGPIVEVTNK